MVGLVADKGTCINNNVYGANIQKQVSASNRKTLKEPLNMGTKTGTNKQRSI